MIHVESRGTIKESKTNNVALISVTVTAVIIIAAMLTTLLWMKRKSMYKEW